MRHSPTSAADTVCIAGVGFAVPKNVRANSEILKAFPHRTEEEVVRLTGIKERRYADDDESATSLAAVAVSHALSTKSSKPPFHAVSSKLSADPAGGPPVLVNNRSPPPNASSVARNWRRF